MPLAALARPPQAAVTLDATTVTVNADGSLTITSPTYAVPKNAWYMNEDFNCAADPQFVHEFVVDATSPTEVPTGVTIPASTWALAGEPSGTSCVGWFAIRTGNPPNGHWTNPATAPSNPFLAP